MEIHANRIAKIATSTISSGVPPLWGRICDMVRLAMTVGKITRTIRRMRRQLALRFQETVSFSSDGMDAASLSGFGTEEIPEPPHRRCAHRCPP